MPKFEITTLKREELDILLEMIKEFAQYEEMEDSLQCSKEKLETSLFDNQFARAFLLKEDENIIGYMIYFYTFHPFGKWWNLFRRYLHKKKFSQERLWASSF